MKLRKYQMISPKNFFFLPKKSTISSEGIGNFLGGVLFLKKVHSWGGVTEMVHGLLLLVL